MDLIVVIRGGGSRNDLAAFDAEGIARAIATSPIPVFTGIGHEIDRSVADEVAGRAWKTPTACAGAIVDMVGEYVSRTEDTWVDIVRLSTARLDGAGVSLMSTAQRVARQTTSPCRVPMNDWRAELDGVGGPASTRRRDEPFRPSEPAAHPSSRCGNTRYGTATR